MKIAIGNDHSAVELKNIIVDFLKEKTIFTVLCASDPYAVLGVQTAFSNHLLPNLVSGPAANTDAAVSLVRKLTGLPALNLLDRSNYPELTGMLKRALNIS